MELIKDLVGLSLIYFAVDYKRTERFKFLSWDNFSIVLIVTVAYYLFKN